MTKVPTKQSISWQATHFMRVVNYIDSSKKILAMICIEKDKSLEDYEHYGFLIDIIDHALIIGEKVLSAEDKILKPLGGRKKIEDILKKLKSLREKDIHAGDEDITIGRWDNLSPEQLAKEIEKISNEN
ncbi:MAG: hypothetical protein ACTSXL_04835 [Alphaproteobacteria bacterium]|nr:MAG: hypothetical protein B6I23_00345 [Rickettsiaceae bacterium 4572_127]